MWSNMKIQVSLCKNCMTTRKSKTNADNRTCSTQVFKKNPAYVSLSTIPSTAALRCLLNGQDQDKPVNKRFSRVLNKSRKNLRKIRMYYLKLTANTNVCKERSTSLSSFKQYGCVSHSMGPQNRCLHIHSDS